ncbi:MAG: sulfur carrier protein ThiS [Planctomycetota bacterium]
MRIEVNGEALELAGDGTVAALLVHLGLDHSPAAVEVNRALVPKREHADRRLAEGDRVEVVTLVGGG